MKAFVIQPFYSFDCNDNDKCFEDMIKLLEECDSSADIIVLPEYCDVPSSMPSKREFDASIKKYNGVILEKAKSTAQRCSAHWQTARLPALPPASAQLQALQSWSAWQCPPVLRV